MVGLDTSPGPTILEPPWEQAPMVETESEIRAAQELARIRDRQP
ncbi:MAG: hypothetical protein OXF88_18715 [Rhodobacteraceae bacterium]|nr:hypothetical protein [Paracoccaceae bacterium]MCY4141322.1 hypothetical protein [Paracoccaceae bacterium]